MPFTVAVPVTFPVPLKEADVQDTSPVAAIVYAVVSEAAEPVMFDVVQATVFRVGPELVTNRFVPFHSTEPATAVVRLVPVCRTNGAEAVVPTSKVSVLVSVPPVKVPAPLVTQESVPPVVLERT
jgi:hypothetical protein